MKINKSPLPRRNPAAQAKPSKPSKSQPNFKGRFINDKTLKKLGDTAIYSSCACAGLGIPFQNGLLFTLNAAFGALAFGAHTSRLFVKTGELLKLKPQIKFAKAENLEQAANFAKENFKINNFKIDDLDTANWVNKGLTRLSNRYQGKTYMPSAVELKDFGEQSCSLGKIEGACYSGKDDIISLNKRAYTGIDRLIRNTLKATVDTVDIRIGASIKSGEFEKQVERYKYAPESFTLPEKLSLWSSATKRGEVFSTIINETERAFAYASRANKEKGCFTEFVGNVNYNPFDFLDHEMGHMFDLKSSSTVDLILHGRRARALQEEIESMVIPVRARDCAAEFTAETFSGIINGDVYPPVIMNVFRKVNNIKLP